MARWLTFLALVRARWGRGQAGTLAAWRDVEESPPFALLGLDSDNGGEFINHHVLRWLQQRARPVFMTRSRPYKKDDNAHVEQKNWTHIRQWFGYERHDNPAVVELTVIQLRQTRVGMATKARLAARRNINTIGRTRMDLITIVAFWQAR